MPYYEHIYYYHRKKTVPLVSAASTGCFLLEGGRTIGVMQTLYIQCVQILTTAFQEAVISSSLYILKEKSWKDVGGGWRWETKEQKNKILELR